MTTKLVRIHDFVQLFQAQMSNYCTFYFFLGEILNRTLMASEKILILSNLRKHFQCLVELIMTY